MKKPSHYIRKFIYRRKVNLLPELPGGYGAGGQDVYVAALLDRPDHGTFVDIGANDGITISNSLYFEKELGWTGLAIEPIPDAYAKLTANRHCHTLNACISDHEGTAEFLEVEGRAQMLSGLVSKYDKQHLRRIDRSIKRLGGSVKKTEVECIRIGTALTRFNIDQIDFLSLDTEGGELDILKDINFTAIPIRAISVENNYFTFAIRDYLEKFGFRHMGTIGVDEIYFRKD
jgi:FkbM family methyltransferase